MKRKVKASRTFSLKDDQDEIEISLGIGLTWEREHKN